MATRYASKFGPNLQNTLNAIANREVFNAGNLAAIDAKFIGELPENERDQFYAADTSYIVYSYNTPIAWFDNNTCSWVVPAVKYSATTSAHQSVVRRAIA